MNELIRTKAKDLIQDKIKEPIQDDLMLAGWDHVRAKLQLQGRSLNSLDNDYISELVAECTIQLVASQASAVILKPLSIFYSDIITLTS